MSTLGSRVLVALAVMAAGAVMGGSPAQAGYPCHDEPSPKDTFVNVNDQTFVGIDIYTNAPFNGSGAWVCATPTGGEAAQKWVVVTAGDHPNASPGAYVAIGGCGVPTLGNEPHPWAHPCGSNYVLEDTGGEVGVPTASPNAPGGGDGTGGSIGGPGPCVQVNDRSQTCPVNPGAGVTVAEHDVQPVPGRVAVNPNASPQRLVTATVGSTTVTTDFPVPSSCIGIC